MNIQAMMKQAQALQAKVANARGKVHKMIEEEMGRATGGLGLPPGLF